VRRLSGFFVEVFERIIPDPYIFAVLLTLLTAVLAFIFAPKHGVVDVLSAWYQGVAGKSNIFEFALQMILILVTGYALANSAPVRRLLERLAGLATTPRAAVTLTFLVSAIACWLNWGFGLVVAGLVAREIARRMRIDFGWLVAAAYSGFLIWASGLSSSIALAQATPGNKLNIIEQLTHQVLPLGATIFTTFNLVPVVALLIILPFVFAAMQPAENDVITGNISALASEEPHAATGTSAARPGTFASKLENAWILNVVLVIAGAAYLGITWSKHFTLDIGSVIFIFLILGLLLHWTPLAYVRAINDAARITGPLLVQYPLYGGIMGIMTATGLAGVIAAAFTTFSTGPTLPFWSYVSSVIISLFVPSGGGHWAVQGPFAVPAAIKLHASLPATAMGVAIGEEVANMIQPFWALPVLAIAGVGLRRVMAFTVVSFVVAFVIFAISLIVLVPR